MTNSTAEMAADTLVALRRAQILCASIRTVARDGADRARLKDIANDAGVSLGLVQHYFRTRHELMEQTFESMMAVSLNAWSRLSEAEPDPLVELFGGLRLHVFGTVTFADRWGFWVELWASSRRDPALAQIAHHVYELWTRPLSTAIGALVQSNVARVDESADQAALVVMALIDGLAVRSLVDPGMLTSRQMYEQLVNATVTLLHIDPERAVEASAAASHLLETTVLPGELSPELLLHVLEARGL